MHVNQCETCFIRDTTCADCDTKYVILTHEEMHRNREHIVALEHTRSDLWGVNEELRENIGALERGQVDLQNTLNMVSGHSTCKCEACVRVFDSFKPKERIKRTFGVEHFNGT